MLDIKFVRSNPELVKENIRKKFQDEKLPLVDEVIALDEQLRAAKTRGDELRALRNTVSREIGGFMKQGLKDKAAEARVSLLSTYSAPNSRTNRSAILMLFLSSRQRKSLHPSDGGMFRFRLLTSC